MLAHQLLSLGHGKPHDKMDLDMRNKRAGPTAGYSFAQYGR